MRATTSLDAFLFIAAVLLIIVGVVGLAIRARVAGRFGRLARIGLATSAVGLATITVSGLLQAIFFGGDFPLMPFLVIPAGLAVVAGFLLAGIGIVRSRMLPRWAGAALIVGALAMLGFNDQDARVLMAVPFGIGWMAVGYVLWSESGASTAQSNPASTGLAG